MGSFNSTDDRRVANSPLRHQSRELSSTERELVASLEDAGERFLDYLAKCPPGREIAIARTKLEEAVMWAVKAATK